MLPIVIYEPVASERDKILAFLKEYSSRDGRKFSIIGNTSTVDRAKACLDQEDGILLLIIGICPGMGSVSAGLEQYANHNNRDNYCLYWVHDMGDLPEVVSMCQHPAGFVLPPPEQAHFNQLLQRICQDYSSISDTSGDSFLALQCGGTLHRLPISSIDYLEALDKRLNIWTGRQCLSVYETIGKMEQLLGDRFFRCHRSYLINLSHLERVNYAGMEVQLYGGIRLPLSRSAKEKLKLRMQKEGIEA